MSNEKRKRSTSLQSVSVKKSKTKADSVRNTKYVKTDEDVAGKKISRGKSAKKEKIKRLDDFKPQSDKERNGQVVRGSMKLKGTNLINTLLQFQRGFCKSSAFEQIAEAVCSQQIQSLHISNHVESPDLRVTAMQWHPSKPHLFVTGGKSGTLQLFQLAPDKTTKELKVRNGIGPGGTIDAIRFNAKRSGTEVCTASVDGTVSTYNFDTEIGKILVDSNSPQNTWFCSVDVHADGKSIYAGDNKGKLAIHHLDSGKTTYDSSSQKIHSAKIRHLEFSLRDPNVLVTASVDRYVKLWDIRKLDVSLKCLEHESGVCAATFSLTNGTRLLTTDIKEQVRVYQAPSFTLEHHIQHPHRHFQHLTSIKASWHPLADVFVIGRYPEPEIKPTKFSSNMRSVDVFSAVSGRLNHELMESSRLITSLAYFNCAGTVLATTSGRTVNLWK